MKPQYIILKYIQRQQITYPSSQHRKEITVNTDEEEESSLWGVLNLVYSVRKSTRYLILLLVMVFIATFNNISAILWRSVLLMEETEVSAKNHQPVASHWQTLSHKVHLAMRWIQTQNFNGDRHCLHSLIIVSINVCIPWRNYERILLVKLIYIYTNHCSPSWSKFRCSSWHLKCTYSLVCHLCLIYLFI